jgi:putative ABC transport system permease protein
VAGLPGIKLATPMLEVIATVPSHPGEYVRLLGIDPFTAEDLRPVRAVDIHDGGFDLDGWLGVPFAGAATAELSALFGRSSGTSLPVNAGTGIIDIPLAFTIEGDGPGSEDPRLMLMDLGWVQELSGRVGKLSSIQIVLENPEGKASLQNQLLTMLPDDLLVEEPAGRSRQTEGMIASFQLNLLALSMVSILVGMFLIYNTMAASVVRRRREIGILRSMGLEGKTIRSLFLAEAAMAGLLGSCLGLMAAPLLASFLVGHAAATISSLYLLTSLQAPTLSTMQILLGLATGMGASLLAAWVPSSEALRVEPREAMHPGTLQRSAHVRAGSLALWGVGALVIAILTGKATLWYSFGPLGFLSALAVIAGFSLITPLTCLIFARGTYSLAGSTNAEIRLAVQNFERSLHRNAVTIAALSAAVAMTVSIATMIHSFRQSVEQWMEATLVADLFLAPAANESIGLQHYLPPEVVSFLQEHPAVREVATFREEPIQLKGRRAFLAVIEGKARGRLVFLPPSDSSAVQKIEEEGCVAVSESLARHFGYQPGDTIEIPTPSGSRGFEVVGIYRDYTRDSGTILMARETFLQFWNRPEIHSVGIFLHHPENQENSLQLQKELREYSGDALPLAVYANRDLKTRVREIFDQTFRITTVLQIVAMVVSVAGVLLGLTTLLAERERERAVLSAMGASPWQIGTITLVEAGCIGLVAALLGVLGGMALAVDLTWVINQAFFGWTVDFAIPWSFVLSTPFWLLAVAILAGIWPSMKAAQSSIAPALREE